MASVSYPSWTAPGSLERDRKKHGQWWNNAKEVFLRPWRRRGHTAMSPSHRESKRKKKTPGLQQHVFTPRTQEDRLRDRVAQQFPPLIKHFDHYSPGRPLDLPERDSSQSASINSSFHPPPYKPSRPSLKNVFPMCDTPKVAPQKPEGPRRHSTGTTNIDRHQLIIADRVSPPPVDRVSPPPVEVAKYESPSSAGVTRYQRPSSASSSSSNERSVDRRQRRVSAARVIPVLPKRQLRRHNTDPTPNFFERGSERPAYSPRHRELQQTEDYPRLRPHYVPPALRNNFAFQPWSPDLASEDASEDFSPDVFAKLHSIQEEKDEIKGFDEFMMY